MHQRVGWVYPGSGVIKGDVFNNVKIKVNHVNLKISQSFSGSEIKKKIMNVYNLYVVLIVAEPVCYRQFQWHLGTRHIVVTAALYGRSRDILKIIPCWTRTTDEYMQYTCVCMPW